MRLISLLTRLAITACFFSAPALGAEIGRHSNDSASLNAVYLHGTIEPGDAGKLRAYILSLPKKRATVVYLNSDGGSFRDGIDMGYVFRTEGVRTVVEGNRARCMSACAFAFMGGFDRATGKPWRAKSSSSRLAFHAFYPRLNQKSYRADEVESLLLNNNLGTALLVTYFKDVDADISILNYAFRMRQTQIYDIADEHALVIGINVWDEVNRKMRLAQSPSSPNQ